MFLKLLILAGIPAPLRGPVSAEPVWSSGKFGASLLRSGDHSASAEQR